MRAVLHRVRRAKVLVDEKIVGQITAGMVVYLGVGKDDTAVDLAYLAEKLATVRIFSDAQDKMNQSIEDIKGGVLLISQFTLYADVRKGRRPSFDAAMAPAEAEAMYLRMIDALRGKGLNVETGVFRADMQIECVVDGPVTILLDSSKLF